MKHSTQLIRSLLGLTVLLASCQVDDSPGILSDSEAQLFVSEALIIMSKLSLKLQKKVN